MWKSITIALALGLSFRAAALVEMPKAPTVFVDTAKEALVYDWLAFPARVIPSRNAAVLAETEGVIKKVLTPLGKAVLRGTPLLIIVNTDPVYQYAPLAQGAPLSGIVSSMEVSEGSRVTKGQRLATITDPLSLKIQIEVAATDLGSLSAGMVGELHLSTQEAPAAVHIIGISPFVDPATGTAAAELALDAPSKNILPGLVGRVTFRAREHQGIQVPEDAVVYRGVIPLIRIVEAGKAKYIPVTLGPMRRGSVEILKGISPGMVIIQRASSFITEGEAVTIEATDNGKKG